MAVENPTDQEPGGEPSADPVEPGKEPVVEPKPEPAVEPIDYSGALPAELQGKSPEEVQSTLQALVKTLDYQSGEIDRLRNQPAPAAVAPTPAEPEKDIKDLIYEDPEAAVVSIMRKNFGPGYDRLESGVEGAMLIEARTTLHDFDHYENDVKTLIAQSGQPMTREGIQWSYLALKGNEAYQREERARKGQPKSQKPTPEVDPDKPESLEFKNDLERDIFKQSRMSEQEWMANRGDGMITLDVPGVE